MIRDTQKAVARLEGLIQKAHAVLATHTPPPPKVRGPPRLDSAAFSEWRTQTLVLLDNLLGRDHTYTERFRSVVKSSPRRGNVETGVGILRAVAEDIDAGLIHADERADDPLPTIRRICTRFHMFARQLRSRHNRRSTLDVKDEYDVQDLLHALLKLHFEDVRPEEWTASYAGRSSRMDFLLKQEQIVVETKKTRPSFSDKDLADQLIVDIERYRAHPDCKTLLCFVYDPEGLIPNPAGLESDLSRTEPMPVHVLIRPQ